MRLNIADQRLVDMVITNDDVRLAGHCGGGFRDWERANFGPNDTDDEWRARHTHFVDNGMPVMEWLAGGDFMAERVVLLKLEREANE